MVLCACLKCDTDVLVDELSACTLWSESCDVIGVGWVCLLVPTVVKQEANKTLSQIDLLPLLLDR
jgi:hypothetical protein